MKCDARFFGLKELPIIDIDTSMIEALAERSSNIGLTVPGVQKKLSLSLSEEGHARITLIDYPAGYILKPQTSEFEQLPEAEDLVMDIADMMGVRTMPHGLIEIGGEYAFITKRADRENGDLYAMEDICQLSERLVQDKYRGSYERCASIIKGYSRRQGFDMSEFFLRIVVCFVTGNSDMHLKNFSLIEQHPGKRDFVLSPAYDLLPVNAVLPEDREETALTLNGKKTNLNRRDFLALAENAGVPTKAAEHMIGDVINKSGAAIDICKKSLLNKGLQESLIGIIRHRTERLKP